MKEELCVPSCVSTERAVTKDCKAEIVPKPGCPLPAVELKAVV